MTDVTTIQGDDEPVVWDLTDDDDQPLNTTNWHAYAQVRPTGLSGVVLHDWTTDDASAVLDGSTVALKVDDSESWTWWRGIYRLYLTDPSGKTQIVDRGSWTVIPGSPGI